MEVFIDHLRFEYQFGRNIAYGSLVNSNTQQVISRGTLAALVEFIRENDYTLINGAELFFKFIELGYAS